MSKLMAHLLEPGLYCRGIWTSLIRKYRIWSIKYFGVDRPELNLTDLEIFILTEAIQAAEVTAEGLAQEAAERAEAGSEGEAQWAIP